jgi:hypothetical protein
VVTAGPPVLEDVRDAADRRRHRRTLERHRLEQRQREPLGDRAEREHVGGGRHVHCVPTGGPVNCIAPSDGITNNPPNRA